ncbi:MAG: DUF5819 family protein [Bacteroidota bacterium]
MPVTGKRIIAVALFLFLAGHFLLVFNYASPFKIGKPLSSASNRYCYPFFHQQWTVFVPTPTRQFDLYIRNGNGTSWQLWMNVTKTLIKKNRKSIIMGKETEVLLVTNAINYLVYDLGDTNHVYEQKPDLPSFKVLEHAARNYFRNYRCWKEGKQYEMAVVAKSPEKTTYYYFKNLSLK